MRIPLGARKPDVREIGRLCALMRSQGIQKVVFARNFPYKAHLLREGFETPDSGLLYEVLAPMAARAASPAASSVYICVGRLTVYTAQTLIELCRSFRYMMVDIESGGGLFLNALARRFGVSVVAGPTPDRLGLADIAVLLSKPPHPVVLSETCLVLASECSFLSNVRCNHVLTGLTVAVPKSAGNAVPKGFPPEPLLAAALYAGTLSGTDLSVCSVRVSPGADGMPVAPMPCVGCPSRRCRDA
jgi:hypothetical protein